MLAIEGVVGLSATMARRTTTPRGAAFELDAEGDEEGGHDAVGVDLVLAVEVVGFAGPAQFRASPEWVIDLAYRGNTGRHLGCLSK